MLDVKQSGAHVRRVWRYMGVYGGVGLSGFMIHLDVS